MKTYIRTKYGYFLINKHDSIIGKSLEKYGEYAQEQVNYFQQIIQKGWTVFDIGAYIGTFTLPFSYFVGQEGSVVAVECERHNYYNLCGNLAVNNITNTFCYQNYVSSSCGSTKINEINQNQINDFSCYNNNIFDINKPYYSISNLSIDNISCDKVNLIKINTKGNEFDILKSAKETIKKHRPIIYVSFANETEKNKILDYMQNEFKYKIFFHKTNLFNINNFNEENENIFSNFLELENILCDPSK